MAHKQVSENPKRYCKTCKREVFQTVHWMSEDPEDKGFYVDWYEMLSKAYCLTCYHKLMEKTKKQ